MVATELTRALPSTLTSLIRKKLRQLCPARTKLPRAWCRFEPKRFRSSRKPPKSARSRYRALCASMPLQASSHFEVDVCLLHNVCGMSRLQEYGHMTLYFGRETLFAQNQITGLHSQGFSGCCLSDRSFSVTKCNGLDGLLPENNLLEG